MTILLADVVRYLRPTASFRSTEAGITEWLGPGVQPTPAEIEAARPAAEAALALPVTNEATLKQQAEAALGANKTFLAITSPANAQIAAQVKALTRQNNGLIRMLLRRFEAVD